MEKLAESSALCAAARLTFVRVGVDTFGAYGPHDRSFLAKLFSRYAKRLSTEGLQRFPGQGIETVF